MKITHNQADSSMTISNYVTSFLKISFITAALFGTLIAQSYATTTLFADAIMKMNIAFNSSAENSNDIKEISMTVHNEQESSITFGEHQLDIKSSFIAWDESAKEHEQILAEILIKKINETGDVEIIHSPSLMIMRNNWAEIKIDPENGKEGFELKMQYEDIYPTDAFNTVPNEPIWLNWGDKSQAEVC